MGEASVGRFLQPAEPVQQGELLVARAAAEPGLRTVVQPGVVVNVARSQHPGPDAVGELNIAIRPERAGWTAGGHGDHAPDVNRRSRGAFRHGGSIPPSTGEKDVFSSVENTAHTARPCRDAHASARLISMPPAPAWLARIPAIRAALEGMDAPVLGRAELEKLFGLRRRQALRLLSPLATLEAGRTGWVERERLLGWLGGLQGKKSVVLEQARRQRLDEALDRRLGELAREKTRDRDLARPVALPAPAPDGAGPWPPGIRLAAAEGSAELRIRFTTPEDLLGRVLLLAEQAAGDPEAFAARLAAGSEEGGRA